MRINSNKPKGKNTMEKKKNGSSPARIGTCTPTSSGEKKWGFIPLGHATTAPSALVFFFTALVKVQVTVLSVLNLPRQGIPATCPIGHWCVCSPVLFASEILCDSPGDSPTYSKQRMNKMRPSRWPCWMETQNARWRHAECLWLVARQLRILNR